MLDRATEHVRLRRAVVRPGRARSSSIPVPGTRPSSAARRTTSASTSPSTGAGNAYVTGQTISPDFPTTPGAYDGTHGGAADAFVAKLDASGSKLVYATYLGGSGAEAGLSIAVDDAGRAYVSGGSASPDFPTTPGAFNRDAQTQRRRLGRQADANGSDLVYSTLLPGNEIAGDFGAAIAVDGTGHAYVAGGTGSPDFPSTPRSFDQTHNGEVNSLDAFVVKLKPDGSGLEFATFLGGQCNEAVTGIALDDDEPDLRHGKHGVGRLPDHGEGATTGCTGATRTSSSSELSADGRKLLASTYLGGKGLDWAQGIALGKAGDVTVTGWTKSGDFPTTPARVRPPLPRRRGCLRRATRHRGFPARLLHLPRRCGERPRSRRRRRHRRQCLRHRRDCLRRVPDHTPARAPRRTSATRTPSSPS